MVQFPKAVREFIVQQFDGYVQSLSEGVRPTGEAFVQHLESATLTVAAERAVGFIKDFLERKKDVQYCRSGREGNSPSGNAGG